jgi:hypothetical protein
MAQTSFPVQIIDRLQTQPLDVPGLLARRFFPDKGQQELARQKETLRTFLQGIRNENEEGRRFVQGFEARMIPQAQAIAGITNSNLNQDLGRQIVRNDNTTSNQERILRAGGDVKSGLYTVAGEQANNLARTQGQYGVEGIRAAGQGATDLARTETQGALERMGAQMPFVQSAQAHDRAIQGDMIGLADRSFAHQAGMAQQFLAHQQQMNKKGLPEQIGGWIQSLAPLALLFSS